MLRHRFDVFGERVFYVFLSILYPYTYTQTASTFITSTEIPPPLQNQLYSVFPITASRQTVYVGTISVHNLN